MQGLNKAEVAGRVVRRRIEREAIMQAGGLEDAEVNGTKLESKGGMDVACLKLNNSSSDLKSPENCWS